MKQLRQHLCFDVSSQTYGSNIAHRLAESSQRYLLSTQGNNAYWGNPLDAQVVWSTMFLWKIPVTMY
jgi:hypothetical protein